MNIDHEKYLHFQQHSTLSNSLVARHIPHMMRSSFLGFLYGSNLGHILEIFHISFPTILSNFRPYSVVIPRLVHLSQHMQKTSYTLM